MTQPISADQPIAEVKREGERWRAYVDPAWFRYFVDVGEVDLTTDVVGVLPVANGGTGGVLPVANGGTGVTTSTGSGSVVRATAPSISGASLASPVISNALLGSSQMNGQMLWWPFATQVTAQMDGNDRNLKSVTAVATTLVLGDKAMLFIVTDKTSGGMSVGVMDATGGVVVIAPGIAGIAFTRLAGTGLQAAVTAGADPRSLSTFAIATGS